MPPQPDLLRRLGIVAALIAGVLLAAVVLLTRAGATADAGATGPLRGVAGCRQLPPFLSRLSPPTELVEHQVDMYFATTDASVQGLALVWRDRQTGEQYVHQEPTWDDAGFIGPLATDRDGNLYLAPTPHTDLNINQPAEQNTIWRVDGATGEMLPYLELEPGGPPSERNPFGILGLTYDCDQHALYAASVAGSSPSTERGRIWRIDLERRQANLVLDGVDALGLAVSTSGQQRTLWYGSARRPALLELELDGRGLATGPSQPALALADIGAQATERVRHLRIGEGDAALTLTPFTFTLQAVGGNPQRTLMLRYDAGEWRLVEGGG